MGFLSKLFGGRDKPQLQVPSAPQYPTAEELFNRAISFGKKEYPLAYGARESALADIGLGPAYYAKWQPTSFEEALAAKNFEDVDRLIKHSLSLSGIESSPALAALRAGAGADIGKYLTDLGEARARYSLSSRLGIDPYSVISPYLSTDVDQSNLQVKADYENALLRAQNDFDKQLKEAAERAAKISTISTLAGGAIGFGLGGPGGAALGASIGGTASPIFGGTTSPISLADALSLYQAFPKTGKVTPVSRETPMRVSGAIRGSPWDWS